jgi:hypothetical protein
MHFEAKFLEAGRDPKRVDRILKVVEVTLRAMVTVSGPREVAEFEISITPNPEKPREPKGPERHRVL